MHISDKITTKINQIILLFTLITLGASFYFVHLLNLSNAKHATISSLDTAMLLTKNLLEEEKQHALSLAVLLSRDSAFLKTYYAKNRTASFHILQSKIDMLEKLQGYKIDIQVHDKDLHTYLRSWDFSIKDVPLASFRKDLVQVKRSRKPLVSIEVGKRFNIKAIAPILNKGAFDGSIEVIEGFSHLQKSLAEHGYTLFVLMYKRYLPIATKLKKHPIFDNRFVVVNNISDTPSLHALRNISLNKLENYGYIIKNDYSFGYFSIKDFQNQNIGYIIISMRNQTSLPKDSYGEKTLYHQNSSGVLIQ